MGVEEGDAVIAANVSDGKHEIFIGTRDGMAIRFPESDVRADGTRRRTASGASRCAKAMRSSRWKC